MLAVAYPWASATSFVTTAGDATPLWEDVTDPTCLVTQQNWPKEFLARRFRRQAL